MQSQFNEIRNLTAGAPIEILVYDSSIKKDKWHPGTFIRIVAASDRAFRVNCRLETGEEITAAAPECIEKALR